MVYAQKLKSLKVHRTQIKQHAVQHAVQIDMYIYGSPPLFTRRAGEAGQPPPLTTKGASASSIHTLSISSAAACIHIQQRIFYTPPQRRTLQVRCCKDTLEQTRTEHNLGSAFGLSRSASSRL